MCVDVGGARVRWKMQVRRGLLSFVDEISTGFGVRWTMGGVGSKWEGVKVHSGNGKGYVSCNVWGVMCMVCTRTQGVRFEFRGQSLALGS